MPSRRQSRSSCGCARSITFSSTLLFLSLILPPSSFAQITTTSATSSESASSTASTTSISSSASSTSSISSTTPRPTPTFYEPAPSISPDVEPDLNVNGSAFHYYFLIIAAAAILLFLCVLYLGQRKKRKAALMRSSSLRALARDVEGFRTRLRGRTGLGWNNATTQRNHVEEGLDERGEAPPPYVPGTKPPSLRSVRRESTGFGEAVGLRPLTPGVEHPPGYNEHAADGNGCR